MSTDGIPKIHKAAVYDNPGTISTKIVYIDTPELDVGEVLIKLSVLYLVPLNS
jgi:propanol-preferring alcohol dehydrogenase